MKKDVLYQAPEVTVLDLTTENLICTSDNVVLGLVTEDEDEW